MSYKNVKSENNLFKTLSNLKQFSSTYTIPAGLQKLTGGEDW
jgi:hypothetical protein